jgi:uncharacterized protein YegP (UPF0339 family)
MYYYKITYDDDGWRARFYSASNGRLIWWTEGYSSYANAESAVTILRANAASAPLR